MYLQPLKAVKRCSCVCVCMCVCVCVCGCVCVCVVDHCLTKLCLLRKMATLGQPYAHAYVNPSRDLDSE